MRKTSVLLAVISVASVVSAAWCWRQLDAARAQVALLEQRLAAPAKPASRPVTSDSPRIAQVASALPTTVDTSTNTDAALDEEFARQKEIRKVMRAARQHELEMLRDPDYRRSMVDDWRRRSAQTRADAIRVVGLTPDQADSLMDLLIVQNMRSMELFDPSEPRSAEAQADTKRMGDANQARIRELLGEEKYQRWTLYQASAGERGEVGQFRVQLSAVAQPLQDRQADDLVESLYSERQRRSREYEDYVTAAGITDRNVVSSQDRQRWLDLEKEANQRIHDSMSVKLTTSQLASLDEMLAGKLAPVEAALRLQLEGRLAKTP